MPKYFHSCSVTVWEQRKGVEVTLHADDKVFQAMSCSSSIRGKFEAELDRLQIQGVIKLVEHSVWALLIVPVLIANGKVRICGDYKLTVNMAQRLTSTQFQTLMACIQSCR